MSSEEDVAALAIKGLTKAYKRSAPKKALDDVSFTVEQGEFFGLLGPNGAGKSTLISALGGLLTPNSGTIEILGKDFKKDWRACKMAIGIVPQEITFDPFFTVRETLKLQSGYFGLRNNDEWIDTIIDRLGLTEKKNETVMRLSGGMKRRVLIAQALVHRPPVIVLDEPTAGVDIELRLQLWDFMRELNEKGHTIILTTHYLEEAERLCHRVALLNHGKLVALDSTKALLHRFSGDRVKFRLTAGELGGNFPLPFTVLEEGVYSVMLDKAEDLSTLLKALEERSCSYEDLELGKANLEEVFLKVMRDA